jgi:hypothetical protein
MKTEDPNNMGDCSVHNPGGAAPHRQGRAPPLAAVVRAALSGTVARICVGDGPVKAVDPMTRRHAQRADGLLISSAPATRCETLQVEVGDQVTVAYYESLAYEVRKSAMARALPWPWAERAGARPAAPPTDHDCDRDDRSDRQGRDDGDAESSRWGMTTVKARNLDNQSRVGRRSRRHHPHRSARNP